MPVPIRAGRPSLLLSLSTSLIPLQPLSLEARIRWILEGEIPGLVPGPELTSAEIPLLIREASGAGHSVTALIAPGSDSSSGDSDLRQPIPSLFAIEENERRHATQSCLQALAAAEQHEIGVVILSSTNNSAIDQHLDHEKVIEEIGAKKKSTAGETGDPKVARWHEKLQLEQQRRLSDLTRKKAPHPDLQRKRQDSLLRSLDAILEQASRRQIQVALRETAEIDGLPQRNSYGEIDEIFRGAPLGLIADPAAAAVLALLRGQDSVPPLPEGQQLSGFILRDCIGTRSDVLLGDGDLDVEIQFGQSGADLLRIVEAPPGTEPDRIRKLVRYCREKGLDGNPPPQPGNPFPIIGTS